MKPIHFIRGHIHAPYFIFIDGGTIYRDEEVMTLLGIEGFVGDPLPDDSKYCVHITDDGRWLHVVDDWGYSQWHSKTTRERIAELATRHDIFSCSVGDVDSSFDFEYYRGGSLVRQYVVEDPHYDGGFVTVDFGIPLPGEAMAFMQAEETDKVLDVARSIGVVINHAPERIRTYAKRCDARQPPPGKPSLFHRLFGLGKAT